MRSSFSFDASDGQDLFLFLDFLLELEGDPDGELLADPRDQRDPGDVAVPDGLLELGRPIPERTFRASFGPMPETPMSFRKSSLSSPVENPIERQGAVREMGVDMELAGRFPRRPAGSRSKAG